VHRVPSNMSHDIPKDFRQSNINCYKSTYQGAFGLAFLFQP